MYKKKIFLKSKLIIIWQDSNYFLYVISKKKIRLHEKKFFYMHMTSITLIQGQLYNQNIHIHFVTNVKIANFLHLIIPK